MRGWNRMLVVVMDASFSCKEDLGVKFQQISKRFGLTYWPLAARDA